MTKPRVALVVAIAEHNVIGKGGTLPWRVPEDMKWFREITMGKPCIMGRKTWESLPKPWRCEQSCCTPPCFTPPLPASLEADIF